jgi:hypothetical protein
MPGSFYFNGICHWLLIQKDHHCVFPIFHLKSVIFLFLKNWLEGKISNRVYFSPHFLAIVIDHYFCSLSQCLSPLFCIFICILNSNFFFKKTNKISYEIKDFTNYVWLNSKVGISLCVFLPVLVYFYICSGGFHLWLIVGNSDVHLVLCSAENVQTALSRHRSHPLGMLWFSKKGESGTTMKTDICTDST